MAISDDVKLRWFDLGAASFARTFPESFPEIADIPVYVCPLCISTDAAGVQTFRAFPREAVAAHTLTAEHVPPASFGGKELLLTCAKCNHEAGAHLDSHARKRENPIDALKGRTQEPVSVRVTTGLGSVIADLKTEGTMHGLKIIDEHKSGPPGSHKVFSDALTTSITSDDRDIHLNFYQDAHSVRRARASWLKSAYLAMFAVAGYEYIFNPALAVVRRQIAEPDVEHIPMFLCVIPSDPPWAERRILRVLEPEWQRSWVVQIGRNMVFLPFSTDLSLYQRLAREHQDTKKETSIHGEPFDWPNGPLFGMA